MMDRRQVLVVACATLREAVCRVISGEKMRAVFLDYGLHLTPGKMAAAIQAQIDALPVPHLVLIGFGLCGNGLAGLHARCHTLVIPRVHDCIALFFGSQSAYRSAFQEEPATYYFTPGWLECGGEPMTEYEKCREKYGERKADLVADAQYRRYRKGCLVALTPQDVERYRPRALEVFEFCQKRWHWQYQEITGSDALIQRLLSAAGAADLKSISAQESDEFVIINPGEEVRQDHFMS